MKKKIMDKLNKDGIEKDRQIVKGCACVAILSLLLVIGISLLLRYGISLYTESNYDDQKNLTESIVETYKKLIENEDTVRNNYYTSLENNAQMHAEILRCFVDGEEYSGPFYTDRGFVVHRTGDEFEIPAGITIDMYRLDLENGTRATAPISSFGEDYIADVYAYELGSGYYYVDWDDVEELDAYLLAYCDTNEGIRQMEDAFDGSILIVYQDEDFPAVAYRSKELEAVDEDVLASFNMDKADPKTHICDLGEHRYSVSEGDIGDKFRLYFFLPEKNIVNEVLRWVTLFAVFVFVVLVSMIVWNLEVQKTVREKVLSSIQEKHYRPGRVRIINMAICILAAVTLFLLSNFNQSLNALYMTSVQGERALSNIEASIEQEKNRAVLSKSERDSWLEYYSEKLGILLSFDIDKANEEMLMGAQLALDAKYIMLFDNNGEEICSSNGFVGYKIDKSDTSENEFRWLLNGVGVINKEAAYDETTRMYTQLVGARVPYDYDYGAVIIAYDGEENGPIDSQTDVVIRSIQGTGGLALVADKESGEITRSSDPAYIDLDSRQIGIQDADARFDSYNIGGTKYYGVRSETEKEVLYYLEKEKTIVSQNTRFSLACSCWFVAMFVVMHLIIQMGYTSNYFEKNVLVGKPVAKGSKIEIQLADGRTKRSTEVSKRFAFIPETIKDKTPEQKTIFVFDALLALTLLNTWAGIYSRSNATNDTLMGFILQGDWTRGVNLFAVSSVFIMVVQFSFGLILLKMLISLLCLVLDTKGETICHLAFNIIRYFVFIAMLYYAFTYLGFNTSGLLASVGFLTLAISIGARDLVADIIAGITIVLEGDYQIGDMVEIGNYRGQVQEVGVRSTKLLGRGDNVKIISNRDVKNVLNMTRLNSWYPVEVRIPRSQPLDEVERILEEELPKIGERNKEIISGPYYYGILDMNSDTITLSILAECREENYHHVQRRLNKELYDLFKAKGIPMA